MKKFRKLLLVSAFVLLASLAYLLPKTTTQNTDNIAAAQENAPCSTFLCDISTAYGF